MINDTISDAAELDGRDMRRTRIGQSGHVVFGPYSHLTHGVYQVDFTLALASVEETADEICAVIDVSADYGHIGITDRAIRTSDLSIEPRTFSLLFVLRDIRTIEYRIFASGNRELLVGSEPRFTRVSGILDETPQGLDHLGSLEEIAFDTRRILRHMTPRAIVGHNKVRLGNVADGGYVCIDDFEGIDTALSFGINDDISWDSDIADRGLRVYQFDHTVSDPAPDDERMVFEAKRIDSYSSAESQSLSDLIHRHDKRRERPNIILKMDIESWEWQVFDATPAEDLSRLAWIVCELHYFQGLARADHRALVDRSLGKLAQHFAAIHIHANVWGGISSLGNVVFPDVVEVTFANRALYRFSEGTELYPSPLDNSCDPRTPDFYLGGFQF